MNEIRGFLFWHCDNNAYGRRYIWKAIVAPWLRGTLGIFVSFLMRSGVALFTGEFIPSEDTVQQGVPMFAIGSLAGYGSRKVFVWIDSHVTRIFALKKKKETAGTYAKVPSLLGMTKEEAEKALADANLSLGEVKSEVTKKKKMIGRVISQEARSELSLDLGSPVGITIGTSEER